MSSATTPSSQKTQARDRFRFIGDLTTGARLSELVSAMMGAIYAEAHARWWPDMVGKGSKPRRVLVAPAMLAAFRDYRAAYGLPPHAGPDDPMPMVLSSRGRALVSVTDEAAAKAIKALFADAAALAQTQGAVDAAAALRHASTHWLRHTMLSAHANKGVNLKTLQDTAGHASIATTSRYLHREDNDRHDELLASIQGDQN